MSAKSTIEWTERTWNPLTGCTKVSSGCDNCYAKTLHERFHGAGSFDTITLHPGRLRQPMTWRKPSKVFVNSMSDLFHTDVPDEFIARVFAAMALAPQHTFQLLTKRHARMRSLLSANTFEVSVHHAIRALADSDLVPAGRARQINRSLDASDWNGRSVLPLPNVHLGVSVEDQHWADLRIPALLDTPAAIRWISAEPLVGPIDLHGQIDPLRGGRPTLLYALPPGKPYFPPGQPGSPLSGPISQKPTLDWVVVGGESGPGARPMRTEWARNLRDQCTDARVPFLFKQWGSWCTPEQMPEPTFRNWEARHASEDRSQPYRVGKKAAGRLLDHIEHNGYPAPIGA